MRSCDYEPKEIYMYETDLELRTDGALYKQDDDLILPYGGNLVNLVVEGKRT